MWESDKTQSIADRLKTIRQKKAELIAEEKELVSILNAAYETTPDLHLKGWKRIRLLTAEIDKSVTQRDIEQLVEQFGVSTVQPSKKEMKALIAAGNAFSWVRIKESYQLRQVAENKEAN